MYILVVVNIWKLNGLMDDCLYVDIVLSIIFICFIKYSIVGYIVLSLF